MSKTRTTSGILSRARATARGFTLLEIIVAVGAVALVSVGIAAIFDSVGKTVNTGRRISRQQALGARIERQIRQDFAAITREGFLVVRNQVASKITGAGGAQGGFNYAASVKVPLTDHDFDAGKDSGDRRIDEVMFFAKGQFTSAMEPVSEEYIAKSNEAAIYYGHGQRRARGSLIAGEDVWANPRLDDDLSIVAQIRPDAQGTCLGVDPSSILPGLTNPNRNASDWVLLRKQTLLIQPQNSTQPRPPLDPAISTSPIAQVMLRDSDVQIALQPAASSIFQRLQRVYPLVVPSCTTSTPPDSMALWALPPSRLNSFTGGFGQDAALRPQISSGLVDIATTDLAEVRRIVTNCPATPTQFSFAYDPANPQFSAGRPQGWNSGTHELDPPVFPEPSAPGVQAWGADSGPVQRPDDGTVPTNNWSTTGASQYTDSALFGLANAGGVAVYRAQAWMQNALPNRSDGFTDQYELTSGRDRRQPGSRVRCETEWTSRDDVIHVTPVAGGNVDPLQTYWKRRAQLALSSQNFLEHCSEFIVEWSFGMTDPRTGSVIWYGSPYQDQTSTDAAREITMYRGDAEPQDLANLPPAFDATRLPYNPWAGDPTLDPSLLQLIGNPADRNDANANVAYHVSKHLIYGNGDNGPFQRTAFVQPQYSDGCVTAHFGYFDPTFNANGHVIQNDNGLADTAPANKHSKTYAQMGINTIPWAWPKMLRFTIRIADEADPTIEDTFQFVIDLPATPHP